MQAMTHVAPRNSTGSTTHVGGAGSPKIVSSSRSAPKPLVTRSVKTTPANRANDAGAMRNAKRPLVLMKPTPMPRKLASKMKFVK